jgi:diguanylate cyclase (GGDEF)-like protein
VDQVTAAALAVALVVNLVVLVAALAWARRQRPGASGARAGTTSDGRASTHFEAGSGGRRDEATAGPARRGVSAPWWRGDAEAGRNEPTLDALEPPIPLSPHGADVLDSLADAAAWRGLVTAEAARVARYGHPATLVIADLEGLDRLSTRLGSESVDRLTAAVAATIRREARATDRVGRLAPARFAVLLPETDEVAAINWVERVREATDLWLEASAVALRLGFGWAELPPDADVDAVLDVARTRLDDDRRQTRNGGRRPGPDARRTSRPGTGRRPGSGVATRDGRSPLPGASGSPLAAG